MTIKRLAVEGGFLDGLDLTFAPGLNCLIGERGTGKTSILEVLRYVLGAGSLVDGTQSKLTARARAALGDGVAHVEVITASGVEVISRSYRDDAPKGSAQLPAITVVGQGEMEAVGLEASSRLRLLDRYGLSASVADAGRANSKLADIRSTTQQLTQVRLDLVRIRDELMPLADVPGELDTAVEAQRLGLESVNATAEEARRLSELQDRAERLRHAISQVSESQTILTANRQHVASALDQWRDSTLAQLASRSATAAKAHEAVAQARESLTKALELTDEGRGELSQLRSDLDGSFAALDIETKQLRDHLESLKAGLSAAARAVEVLRERAGTRSALMERQEQLETEFLRLLAVRQQHYADVEELREGRRVRRSDVAGLLAAEFGPHVRVSVAGGADRSHFRAGIVNALTGSGLHYNTLAPLIADSMTPLELIEAVEREDESAIARAAGIPDARGAQVAMQLSTSDLGALAISPIDDSVSLELLDGSDYKPMNDLSIGQRCTVVLPVVLGAPTSCLILDQPEDNLDNAYLATTIVPGVIKRAAESQVIVATHNPNIPVLGGATMVAHLGSDGSRGFVVSIGPLDDPATRGAITDIMEGGAAAFQRRAEFYGIDKP